jgi:cysteine desulfurase
LRKVYLDHAATTPLDPRVLEAMLPYLRDIFGNPSSLHDWGDEPREALEVARGQVARLIGAQPQEVMFTGNATEANNFAIKGLALSQQDKGKHILVSAVEHFSVLNAARTMGKLGFEVGQVPVDKHGLVSPEEVKRRLRPDTILVSVMHANAEIGTIEPIAEIARVVKETGAIFHTDATAAAGIIPLNVAGLGVDALTLAANQFYGPKGVGALWLRRGVRIMPLLDGGIQEGGRRAGTEDVAAIVGLGKAAELAQQEMSARREHLTPLRDRLIQGIASRIEHSLLTGHPTVRLPGHASFCIEFIEGEAMLMLLNAQGVATSSGSSCTSRALKASHVLTAIGLPPEIAQGSLVFTLGQSNSREDIDYMLEEMPQVVDRLRQMSPLFAKFVKAQKGGK